MSRLKCSNFLLKNTSDYTIARNSVLSNFESNFCINSIFGKTKYSTQVLKRPTVVATFCGNPKITWLTNWFRKLGIK